MGQSVSAFGVAFSQIIETASPITQSIVDDENFNLLKNTINLDNIVLKQFKKNINLPCKWCQKENTITLHIMEINNLIDTDNLLQETKTATGKECWSCIQCYLKDYAKINDHVWEIRGIYFTKQYKFITN